MSRPPGPSLPAPERFHTRYRVDAARGCWVWQGALKDGYGRFCPDGHKPRRAHVVAYEQLVGPVPEGLELDHTCRNRACVNPAHLEPVKHRANLLRGATIPAANAAKTHCPAGHPYEGANLYVDKLGRRYCRICQRGRARHAQA